jgi:glycosyltransferase involved in cell wall biosynthesis
MNTYIGACDLVALPLQSMRDKLDIPTTLLEAMAAAKPILISDIPPMNELVSENVRPEDRVGVKFPSGDIQSLAKGVNEILNDDCRHLQMGLNAQEYVRTHFDISQVAEHYLSLYREVSG